jgi:hypothetical protein
VRISFLIRGSTPRTSKSSSSPSRTSSGEKFDAKGVPFVAVTQQFNTSMRRLTLNALLSFAQFEREVIGE